MVLGSRRNRQCRWLAVCAVGRTETSGCCECSWIDASIAPLETSNRHPHCRTIAISSRNLSLNYCLQQSRNYPDFQPVR